MYFVSFNLSALLFVSYNFSNPHKSANNREFCYLFYKSYIFIFGSIYFFITPGEKERVSR